jgi:hypothetical protein
MVWLENCKEQGEFVSLIVGAKIANSSKKCKNAKYNIKTIYNDLGVNSPIFK